MENGPLMEVGVGVEGEAVLLVHILEELVELGRLGRGVLPEKFTRRKCHVAGEVKVLFWRIPRDQCSMFDWPFSIARSA